MKKTSDTVRSRLPEHVIKWLEEGMKVNAQNENAVLILKEAIQTTASNSAMTPEVKELAEMLIILIEDREPFKYDFDALMEPVVKIVEKDTKSNSGKNAAKARHANDYKLHEEIKRVWSEGNFSSRDLCAEQEYSSLGFKSFKAARNALKNTPDPSSWPAKTIKK